MKINLLYIGCVLVGTYLKKENAEKKLNEHKLKLEDKNMRFFQDDNFIDTYDILDIEEK